MAEVHADRASRGKEVLGVGDVARSLTRIAYEIVERNGGSNNLVIAGIPTRGATLARRLVNRIKEVSGTYAELAIIDTTMYRDDLASQPLRAPKETLFCSLRCAGLQKRPCFAPCVARGTENHGFSLSSAANSLLNRPPIRRCAFASGRTVYICAPIIKSTDR